MGVFPSLMPVIEEGGGDWKRGRNQGLNMSGRGLLLQVFEEASVAEVVDVSTDEHQVRVYVVGHTAVGWHGVVEGGRDHQGGGVGAETLFTALHQGTKSDHTQTSGQHRFVRVRLS